MQKLYQSEEERKEIKKMLETLLKNQTKGSAFQEAKGMSRQNVK